MDMDLWTPEPGAVHRAELAAAIEAMPVAAWVGLRVIGFDAAGRSRIELPVVPTLTFDGQAVQGGIVGLLADFAGVSAVACTLPPGGMASTTGYEVHHLAPARGERLIAIGQAVRVGQSSAVSRVEVFAQSGDTPAAALVCIATTTCRPYRSGR